LVKDANNSNFSIANIIQNPV
jgi:hypothetical protein